MSIPVRPINQAGLGLIMKFEGCKLGAYFCPAGVLTIGYGHTGADVKQGDKITEADAERLLLKDLKKFCDAVAEMVSVDINDNQFSALVCIAFNIGADALKKSTLMKNVNAKSFAKAAAEFDKWNKAAGVVLTGLVKRRAAERALFTS